MYKIIIFQGEGVKGGVGWITQPRPAPPHPLKVYSHPFNNTHTTATETLSSFFSFPLPLLSDCVPVELILYGLLSAGTITSIDVLSPPGCAAMRNTTDSHYLIDLISNSKRPDFYI